MLRVPCFVALIFCSSCMEPTALPDAERSAPEVDVTKARGDFVERVIRVEVAGIDGVAPQNLALFSGELSEYQLNRIDAGELPANLSERRVPAVTWLDPATGKLSLAPSQVLDLGGRYTLVAPGYGRLAILDVDPTPNLPLLERIWPPKGRYGGGVAVLCGDSLPASDESVRVDPLGLVVGLSIHAGSDVSGRPCAEFSLPKHLEPNQFVVLPARIGDHLVDPEPWQLAPSQFPVATCEADRVALGPGCAEVQDDRLIVEAAPQARLWIVHAELDAQVFTVNAGARFALRGLSPDSELHLRGRVIGPGGDDVAFEVAFTTGAARLHVVLNEVLANALGPEPLAEWIEIFNDGALEIDTDGWVIEDAGGAIALPRSRLAPGTYALIVREDFELGAGPDVAPDAEVQTIRVPALGKSGLSNSGEAFTLKDREGNVLSYFAALPHKVPGVSMARRRPDALDDDPAAFGPHAAPGASPGRENQLADE